MLRALFCVIALLPPLVADEAKDRLREFLESGWNFDITSEAELVRRFGPPVLREQRVIMRPSSGHQPVTELRWHGLEVVLQEQTASTRELRPQIWKLVVRTPKLKLLYGLRVGRMFSEVRDVLGKPRQRSDARMVYTGEHRSLIFSGWNQRVMTIEWRIQP